MKISRSILADAMRPAAAVLGKVVMDVVFSRQNFKLLSVIMLLHSLLQSYCSATGRGSRIVWL